MIWYALHLRLYVAPSEQVLLEKFPMLSLPLLDKIQHGGVEAF